MTAMMRSATIQPNMDRISIPAIASADTTSSATVVAGRSRRATWLRPDLSRDAMLLIGLLAGLGQVAGLISPPGDSLAYWAAGTSKLLYPEHWSQAATGLLFYPPPVAQLSVLIQPIGWAAFDVVWNVLIFACFWYCAGRWSLPLVAVGLLPLIGVPVPIVGTFLGYALLGNMQWILAALVIVGLRHPAAWAVQVVTKTGPAVGVFWNIFRGEWRAVFTAAVATAAVVAISFAIAPSMWADWIAFVARNYTFANPPDPLFPVPFWIRALTALALVAWGARTDRRWTVPIAAGWALPALYGFGFLPFWIAARRVTSSPASRTEPERTRS